MRRALGLLLALTLITQSASAGVNSHRAKVSGGSTPAPVVGSEGVFDSTEEAQLIFKYKVRVKGNTGSFPDGVFELPYAKINKLIYGQTKNLRVGQTIALSAVAGVGVFSYCCQRVIRITSRSTIQINRIMNRRSHLKLAKMPSGRSSIL
jgi:hypothetical protein